MFEREMEKLAGDAIAVGQTLAEQRDKALAEIDRLRAENARLRAALKEAIPQVQRRAQDLASSMPLRARLVSRIADRCEAALKEGSDHG